MGAFDGEGAGIAAGLKGDTVPGLAAASAVSSSARLVTVVVGVGQFA